MPNFLNRAANYISRSTTAIQQFASIDINESGEIDIATNEQVVQDLTKNLKDHTKKLYELLPNKFLFRVHNAGEGSLKSKALIEQIGTQLIKNEEGLYGGVIVDGKLAISAESQEKLFLSIFVGVTSICLKNNECSSFESFAREAFTKDSKITYDDVLNKVREVLANKNHSEENHSKDWREKEDARSGVSTIGR